MPKSFQRPEIYHRMALGLHRGQKRRSNGNLESVQAGSLRIVPNENAVSAGSGLGDALSPTHAPGSTQV